jgi:hypothetical protein
MGKVGTEAERIALSEQQETFLVLTVNSCEYCMDMIPTLHTQV